MNRQEVSVLAAFNYRDVEKDLSTNYLVNATKLVLVAFADTILSVECAFIAESVIHRPRFRFG